MVFILRPSGGHVDGSTCFGVQTSSAQPPYSLTGMFYSNFRRTKHDSKCWYALWLFIICLAHFQIMK